VEPGDLLVGDSDGVVVVPDAVVSDLAATAMEQERQERFVAEQVDQGASIVDLYPMGEKWRRAYEQWIDPAAPNHEDGT
jgi:regulator of RNase E activity RraA